MKEQLAIDGRPITKERPPYIVAEISGNHNGKLSQALELVSQAKAAGADAVKLQTYTPDTITIDHDGPGFVIESGLWKGQSLYELYKKAYTPVDWHRPLFEHARKIGSTVFSSPFDPSAIELLESLNSPAYKIASPEIVDVNLIEACAKTGKPLIVSTGMATLADIEGALTAANRAGAKHVILLHCVSAYPTPIDETNLSTIYDLEKRFSYPVGLSDHTTDTRAATIAVGLGATLIEKHITLSRTNGGVDNAFSLEPHEFRNLVMNTRLAHAALGKPQYTPQKSEKEMLFARRSLYAVADVSEGEMFTQNNVRSIRPNLGLHPKYYNVILGKSATRNIKRGEPLVFSMVQGASSKYSK